MKPGAGSQAGRVGTGIIMRTKQAPDMILSQCGPCWRSQGRGMAGKWYHHWCYEAAITTSGLRWTENRRRGTQEG